MNARTLLDNFDLLAEAPGGVPKLRELILQLAVRGKLVPQEAVTKKGEIHHEEHEGHEGKEEGERIEGPYAVPLGWRWTTLRSVSSDLGQRVPDARFTYVDVSAIDKERGRIGDAVQVLRPEEAPSRARKIVKQGTVIYSTVRPYLLNIAVVDREFDPTPIVSTAFFVMHPHPEVNGRFLFYYLRSQPFTKYVNGAMTGMAYPAVNDAKMSAGPFPLPPLAEQKRIVARVDELMKRCDELEARQKERNERRTALTASCLHALTAGTSPVPPSTRHRHERAWSRVRDHFPLLIDTPESVAELRKTILQLAVQGRLVPQDPRDEPAVELLGRIRVAGECSRKRAGRQQTEPMSPHMRSTNPYDLPKGWTLARFLELGEFGRGKSKHRPRNDPALYKGGRYPMVQTGDVARATGFVTTCTALYNEVGLAQSRMWPAGTMCVTIAANIADTAILDFDACFPDSVVGFVPSPLIGDAQYFEYFMRTAQDKLADFAPSTAQKNINLGILNAVMIPLPPLSEIRRIVTKVKELMVLCDALEARLTQSREDADAFAAAVVNNLCGNTQQGIYNGESCVVGNIGGSNVEASS